MLSLSIFVRPAFGPVLATTEFIKARSSTLLHRQEIRSHNSSWAERHIFTSSCFLEEGGVVHDNQQRGVWAWQQNNRER
ncbi:hypothetical protein ATANTOWER_001021 [Ataeniobius toweri]|uniref:Secreted protein n=1 Tax=Ataeniobius toweri TaxID=208326 RepID=A0ABU7AV75_9TELE|nr:hypothetical protein [Ataeniobius toweri]